MRSSSAAASLSWESRVVRVASAKQFVAEHGGEGGRNAQREMERHRVRLERSKYAKERKIGLGNRLEEPTLLQEIRMLRPTDEWHMRIEDEGEVGGFHP